MLDTPLHFVNGIVILLAAIFGSSMNICSKINSRAARNGMVIGQGLRQKLEEYDDYITKELDKYGWAN